MTMAISHNHTFHFAKQCTNCLYNDGLFKIVITKKYIHIKTELLENKDKNVTLPCTNTNLNITLRHKT